MLPVPSSGIAPGDLRPEFRHPGEPRLWDVGPLPGEAVGYDPVELFRLGQLEYPAPVVPAAAAELGHQEHAGVTFAVGAHVGHVEFLAGGLAGLGGPGEPAQDRDIDVGPEVTAAHPLNGRPLARDDQGHGL